MLKIVVGNHHVASNNITYSMNIRWIKMLHIIIPFILPHSIQWALPAMLQLRCIWVRRKTIFFSRYASSMIKWNMIEGSGLERNDRDILKFAFDVHFHAFRCWFWRNLTKLTNFENCLKLWTGCAHRNYENFAFSMRASYSAAQNAVYWVLRARIFGKKYKHGSAYCGTGSVRVYGAACVMHVLTPIFYFDLFLSPISFCFVYFFYFTSVKHSYVLDFVSNCFSVLV